MKILFITGASHEPYMVNLNHFQRVYFLSRWAQLTILGAKKSDFSVSAAPGTTVVKSPIPGKLGALIYAFFWLIRNSRKMNFDVVITEPSTLSLCGFVAKMVSRTKWVVDVWDIPIRCQSQSVLLKLKTYSQRKFFKFFYRFADLFIVSILPDFELKFFDLPSKKMLLMKNAIWLDNVTRNGLISYGAESGPFNILCARSRFTKDSGLDVLARAFSNVTHELPRATLTVVGKIPTALKQQIAPLSGLTNVNYFDFVEHNKLMEMVKTASVCVIPFKNVPDLAQTYPVKLLEYLTLGAVVVSSDIAGLSKIIQHGRNGLLFRAGDHQDLAEKIRLLYKDTKYRDTLAQNTGDVNSEYDCSQKNRIIFEYLKNLVGENETG